MPLPMLLPPPCCWHVAPMSLRCCQIAAASEVWPESRRALPNTDSAKSQPSRKAHSNTELTAQAKRRRPDWDGSNQARGVVLVVRATFLFSPNAWRFAMSFILLVMSCGECAKSACTRIQRRSEAIGRCANAQTHKVREQAVNSFTNIRHHRRACGGPAEGVSQGGGPIASHEL